MTGFHAYELMLGDCLERMREIPDGSVDMVLADLPYGTTACKWDAVIPFEPLWAHYKRVCKPNAAIVLTASQPFTSALVMSNPRMFKHEWIWAKNKGSNFLNTKREPMKEHESALVFSAGAWTFNQQLEERAPSGAARVKSAVGGATVQSDNYSLLGLGRGKVYASLRCPRSWQRFNVERGLHPTQKPVALMEYFIRTYSNPGELILDNTMGSGTTGVAAVNTGRRFIGIEMEPKYLEICKIRLAEASVQIPLLNEVA